MKKIGILIMLLMSICLGSMAQTKTVRLFHIERSTNDNIVCYEANLKNGVPDAKKPIVAYWSSLSKPKHDELTMLDKIAFGHSFKNVGSNEYDITLRASSQKIFRLCKRDGKWITTTKINGVEAQVLRLYVKMKSAMKADYLDIFGKDLATGKEVRERLK